MEQRSPQVPASLSSAKRTAHLWVDDNHSQWSRWNAHIWDFAETAWREYRSAEWYATKLKMEGFSVEQGSGGMPTAFSATWASGAGPTIMAYAEYDAVPGNCQKAATYRAPRLGLSRFAGGHTDPHSALGIGALVGVLAAKAAMEKHGLNGTLRFMGEPAEKMRGSKPIHAARGYYDGLDAVISFHPFYMLPLCNTARWDTHCGPYYCILYEFLCDEPEHWLALVEYGSTLPFPAAHTAARAPGANDAAAAMYTFSKMLRDHMLPHAGTWSINEIILASGQATADNLPAQMAQVVFAIRAPAVAMLEKVMAVLDRNAEAAAALSHCRVRKHWISKSRPGLANHAMAEAAYRNLVAAGAPRWEGEAIAVARALQRELGIAPMARPFIREIEELIEPRTAEEKIRADIPAWQTHYTSDDYTDMSWHAPTARFYVGRAALKAPAGFHYPDWVMNALGGIPETIDPTITTAAKTIAGTILELLTDTAILARAKAEFIDRTGGGIGGDRWLKPLCAYVPPIDFPWPRYFETTQGREWWIPETADDRKLHR
jgi:aminobenzoyl-glutamate utilization protein B